MRTMRKLPLPIAGLLLAGTVSVLAACATFILVNGMVEGPDPIPTAWPDALEATHGETPEFGFEDDGTPESVAFDPETGNPAVVWGYWVGGDHDIAFSEWNGEEWDKVEFLSAGAEEDTDPRLVFASNGRVFVVWWQDADVDRVFLAEREADGNWLPAGQWNGSRPEIATVGHDVHVVFERPIQGGTEIAHLVAGENGGVSLTPIARARRSGPLHAGLHRQDGRLWAYWQHTASQIAWSEYVDGRWVAPASLP